MPSLLSESIKRTHCNHPGTTPPKSAMGVKLFFLVSGQVLSSLIRFQPEVLLLSKRELALTLARVRMQPLMSQTLSQYCVPMRSTGLVAYLCLIIIRSLVLEGKCLQYIPDALDNIQMYAKGSSLDFSHFRQGNLFSALMCLSLPTPPPSSRVPGKTLRQYRNYSGVEDFSSLSLKKNVSFSFP